MKSIKSKEERVGRTKCQIWSRVVGYLRPISKWNNGKLAEFEDRKNFKN